MWPENFFFHKKNFFHTQKPRNLFTLKIMQPLHRQKKSCNLSTKQSHNLSAKKITQPLENISCNPSEWVRKITQPLHTQNHATSKQIISCNLSTKKKHAASPQKNHASSLQKTLWESQNAALRTSHGLSNVWNCSF